MSNSTPPQDDCGLDCKRARVTEIDAGILALLDERMRLAIDIAQIKQQTGKDIEDLERETQLLSEILKQNRETIMDDNRVAEIWQAIFQLSKDIQEEATNSPGWFTLLCCVRRSFNVGGRPPQLAAQHEAISSKTLDTRLESLEVYFEIFNGSASTPEKLLELPPWMFPNCSPWPYW